MVEWRYFCSAVQDVILELVLDIYGLNSENVSLLSCIEIDGIKLVTTDLSH